MNWDLTLMGFMYGFAGAMHFIKPKAYIEVMPDFFKAKKILVYLSGAIEILLGIGLFFENTRSFAGIGIVLILIAFLSVHFNMLRGEKYAMGIPKWVLLLRIPLQFILIWWAYIYI